ncbi:SEC-C metal-binding domain-containing protein [Aneurinibacillus terranovensis]|uniref:SEC-C metal-binding domain-containing protein n=1 Tax=Aneurinibacillus terranovensis TaxID=278991 RepID=UPI000428560B|nr:SEC-C metal-binding domain-containing protein [Aneurinibacillus terranovensis]
MIKVGRNDPCPCGSGKKYKRCCLEKDQQNNVIRIASHSDEENNWPPCEQHPEQIDYDSLVTLIEEELDWGNFLYQLIARKILDNMVQEYDLESVVAGILLWNAYSSVIQPIIRKVGVYPAAVEYCIDQLYGRAEATQAGLAKKYGLSAGTISQRVNQLLDFAEDLAEHIALTDDEDDEDPFLLPPLPRSIGTEREMRTKKALQLSPDGPDAYNILAETADSLEDMIEYYRQGMLAGERNLGQAFFKENKGHFWGMIETRPYMRSKLGYAQGLSFLGHLKEAVREYKELLELNPNDNQGVRYALLTAYIEWRKYSEALKVINTYSEDHTANFNYNRILIEYGKNGVSSRLVSLLQEAIQQNSFVVDYVLGKKRIPDEMPEYIGFGDKDEAVAYVQDHIHLWQREPVLMRWLKEQVKANTPGKSKK